MSEDLTVTEAPDRFVASEGWLTRWKSRHGVRQLQICGEKLSADLSVVEEYKNKFQTILEENGYTPDQVYKCDETGLYYKMMPSKTLAGETENSAPGLKKNKERLTILAYSSCYIILPSCGMENNRENRRRGKNFTNEEVLLLAELVAKNRSVIENKQSGAITHKQKESAALLFKM
jgi:hypothetical protein